jgi:hypothetical protein
MIACSRLRSTRAELLCSRGRPPPISRVRRACLAGRTTTSFPRARLATRVEGSATTRVTSLGVSKHGDPGIQETGENHGLVQEQCAAKGFVAEGPLQNFLGQSSTGSLAFDFLDGLPLHVARIVSAATLAADFSLGTRAPPPAFCRKTKTGSTSALGCPQLTPIPLSLRLRLLREMP